VHDPAQLILVVVGGSLRLNIGEVQIPRPGGELAWRIDASDAAGEHLKSASFQWRA
jgi:hypothetical protein